MRARANLRGELKRESVPGGEVQTRRSRGLVSIMKYEDGYHISRLGDNHIYVFETYEAAVRRVHQLLGE